MAADLAHTSIKVNSMYPGWVKTEMGGDGAPKTIEEGADTIVWLATTPEIPTGKIFFERKETNW
jgi:NAD(P)-dependent dehydrogenase (short-subunit alcohol dehydrogenase family)